MNIQDSENLKYIIKKSILNRLNLPHDYLGFSHYSIKFNLEESLDVISGELKFISKKLKLQEFIDSTYNKLQEENISMVTDEVKKEISQEQKRKPKNWVDKVFLSDDEKETLKEEGRKLIISSNPEPILSAIGANFNPVGNKIKITSIAGEPTKTCSFGVNGNAWLFNRFGGAGQSGTIIDFVMLETGMAYKEVMQTCYNALNINDPYTDAINAVKAENDRRFAAAGISKKDYEKPASKDVKKIDEILNQTQKRNEELARQNAQIEKESSNRSRVTKVSTQIPYKLKKKLEARGFAKIPKELVYIEMEYKKQNSNDTYKVGGAGILCGNTSSKIYSELEQNHTVNLNDDFETTTLGADVHYPFYVNNGKLATACLGQDKKELKTRSAGPKEYTFIDNKSDLEEKKRKPIAVFESKNDYFAACQETNFQKNNIDVVVANGVGQSKNINKLIIEKGYHSVLLYTQFDTPAIDFASKTLDGYKNSIQSVTYKDNELNIDPNDIIIKGDKIINRFKSFPNKQEMIVSLASSYENSLRISSVEAAEKEKAQKELKKVLDDNKIIIDSETTLNLG